MTSSSSHPIVIVTGANIGVGFGICRRFLFQLSRPERASNDLELSDCNGLTLILACRNKQRAEAARTKLCDIADTLIRSAKCSPGYDGHAETLRKNLHIVVHTVDLSNIQSVFRFADQVSQNYPYVSHLVCNAGIAAFQKIIWPLACYHLITDWVGAVTSPQFYIQRVGDMSQDGLGLVWQSNVFGHYALFRALEPLLAKYTGATGARVVWMSSHEAGPKYYDPKDWQLIKSEHSYECSKYQMNMISLHLDRQAIRGQSNGRPVVRHFITYPGVAGTNIASALVGNFMSFWMFVALYIARFLGSQDFPIDVFKAAVSVVHISFVRIACLSTGPSVESKEPVKVGAAYPAKADWWGREYVGTVQVIQSREEELQTIEFVGNCDRLLKAYCDIHGRKSLSG